MRNWTEAKSSQALALAIVASQSLARRRLRLSPSKGAFDKPAAQGGVEIVIALIRPLSVLGEPARLVYGVPACGNLHMYGWC